MERKYKNMSILNQWLALPFNVQRKLAVEFKIKDYGTTESQLIFELQTKLPKGLLGEEDILEQEEIGEPPVSTGKEPVIEEEKPKKKRAKKTKK